MSEQDNTPELVLRPAACGTTAAPFPLLAAPPDPGTTHPRVIRFRTYFCFATWVQSLQLRQPK
jgi:hypothetical protein